MIRSSAAFRSVLVSVTTLASACGGQGGSEKGGAVPSASSAPDSRVDPLDISPEGPPKEVDCGDFSTCAIAADGELRCWGRDKLGELGDGAGKRERVKRSVVPGVGKVKKVALASQFGCAITESDTVVCWGTGRIANDGKVLAVSKPVFVSGVEGAEELVASGAIACARGARGIVCWGAEGKSPGAPPKGRFKQMAAGFTHACALDEKGAVTCWGQGDWDGKGAYAKPGIVGVQQIATGDRHGCGLMKDRSVQCWGMNDAGQLGITADAAAHKKPVVVPGLANVVKIVAGEASTCALGSDGSVRCWGANGEGELGLGMRSLYERPTQLALLSEVEQICLASAHGCALTKESKLLCWGSNAFGQLGDGTKERRSTPTPIIW